MGLWLLCSLLILYTQRATRVEQSIDYERIKTMSYTFYIETAFHVPAWQGAALDSTTAYYYESIPLPVQGLL